MGYVCWEYIFLFLCFIGSIKGGFSHVTPAGCMKGNPKFYDMRDFGISFSSHYDYETSAYLTNLGETYNKGGIFIVPMPWAARNLNTMGRG